MVNNHGDRVRPLTGVMGPLINGRTSWLINGGDPNWDDPPSKDLHLEDDPPSKDLHLEGETKKLQKMMFSGPSFQDSCCD